MNLSNLTFSIEISVVFELNVDDVQLLSQKDGSVTFLFCSTLLITFSQLTNILMALSFWVLTELA